MAAFLTTSAGARLTVIRFGGSPRPSEASAARTRSRDSATALSGSPTMVKAGSPEAIVTWVSTSMTSTPWNATVRTFATIPLKPYKHRLNIAVYGRKCQQRPAAGNQVLRQGRGFAVSRLGEYRSSTGAQMMYPAATWICE
jgi:hypothetical protein